MCWTIFRWVDRAQRSLEKNRFITFPAGLLVSQQPPLFYCATTINREHITLFVEYVHNHNPPQTATLRFLWLAEEQ